MNGKELIKVLNTIVEEKNISADFKIASSDKIASIQNSEGTSITNTTDKVSESCKIVRTYNGEKHYRIGVIDTTTGQSQNDFINATCEDSIIELYLSDKQFLYNGSNYKLIASKNFKYNKIENK